MVVDIANGPIKSFIYSFSSLFAIVANCCIYKDIKFTRLLISINLEGSWDWRRLLPKVALDVPGGEGRSHEIVCRISWLLVLWRGWFTGWLVVSVCDGVCLRRWLRMFQGASWDDPTRLSAGPPGSWPYGGAGSRVKPKVTRRTDRLDAQAALLMAYDVMPRQLLLRN